MYMCLQFLLFGLLIQQLNSISVGIESSQQKCFFVDGQKDQILTISYVVSGVGEENVDMTLHFENGNEIRYFSGKKEATFEQTLLAQGEYKICFRATDSYYKLLSFDFDISGVDKNYALKEQVEKINIDLQAAFKQMQMVFRNQHFQFDRENTHSELLQSTEKKVKYCALTKMIVLMVICLTQIYLLTNFFKDKNFGPNV